MQSKSKNISKVIKMMDDNHLAAKDSKTRQNVLKLKKGVSGKKVDGESSWKNRLFEEMTEMSSPSHIKLDLSY